MILNEHPRAGTLVKLTTGVYWYRDQRIDDLTDLPLLLLDFTAKPVGTVSSADDTADGMTMDRGNRSGIATLLIDGAPRTVWIFGRTMTALEV
jgi:hypothetical protein